MPIGSVDWIEEGMLLDELRAVGKDEYEIEVRNQFFHGAHPVGWIRDLNVEVGETQAVDVRFVVRGQSLPIDLVRVTPDIWWYPREVATIRFRAPGITEFRPSLVACTFDVSTFFFTPVVDRDGRYPTMRLRLEREMVPVATA